MKRSSAFLLASLTAAALAACNPGRNDTTKTNGVGSESGAASGTSTTSDTTTTGTIRDTGRTGADTTSR